MVHIGNDWDDLLCDEFQKDYYQKLRAFLKNEYTTKTIYPDMNDIFNALKATSYQNTKVVIIGQDPYHEEGQAHGLCFSVNPNIPTPPSLQNIYKELYDEIGMPIPNDGYLQGWAKQGVLMLNSVLTVRAHQANSHSNKGWEILTDRIISLLGQRQEALVFMLWGANARSKKSLINTNKHLVLEAVHPSPLSAYRGFFGCGHFVKCNEFLIKNGNTPINWQQRY